MTHSVPPKTLTGTEYLAHTLAGAEYVDQIRIWFYELRRRAPLCSISAQERGSTSGFSRNAASR
jgi:hypothetical protein